MSKRYAALGLMSGTSLDGIDIAYLESDGEAEVGDSISRTYPYSPAQQALLQQALSAAKSLTQRERRCEILLTTEQKITEWHVEAVREFLQEIGKSAREIDVIGFHGQTVLHRPEDKLTVQLGDGAALAKELGCPVVYDMRAADVAAGGQGAPLVPAYHGALAEKIKDRPVVFVNIGGVANLTWVGPHSELLAFDTGPGNALLNDWTMQHLGHPQDTDGQLAAQGQVQSSIIEQALDLPYFHKAPPKSLDRNAFQHLKLEDLSPADGAATLLELTVESIMAAFRWLPAPPHQMVITGGGRKNKELMKRLRTRHAAVHSAEELCFDGDAMEAEAWAYLAIRSLKNLPLTYPTTTGVPHALSGGVLALP